MYLFTFKKTVIKMAILYILYLLIFAIFALVGYAVLQIKLFGMNVKDFWSFIEANQTLDKLYNFAKYYEKMTTQQQVVYLMEAEKVFNAFDKIPKMVWEEEYEKYNKVLDTYKNIKLVRWESSNFNTVK